MLQTDLNETQYEDALAEHGARVDIIHQQSNGSFQATAAARAYGDATLHCGNHNQAFFTHLLPPERGVGFITATSPCGAIMANGQSIEGAMVLFNYREGADLFAPQGTSAECITLPEAGFWSLIDAVSPELNQTDHALVVHGDPATLGRLRAKLRDLANSCLDNEPDEEVCNLLAEFGAWLANPEIEGRRHASCAQSGRVARRARAFFTEHFAQPLLMEDVCSELGVSLRSLQRCFADYYQVAPYQYLKTLRYNKARHALLRHTPASSSVTRIASDCGFQHLGRFSVEYKSLFGELPKKTLANAAAA